jgi:hypothetical protein
MERTIKPNQDSFRLQLCQILKLNPAKIKTITIKIQSDDSIQVTTEEILLVDEAKEVLKMLHYYHLVENINDGTKK